MLIIKSGNLNIWKKLPLKGTIAHYETDMVSSEIELKKEILELTKDYPNIPFLVDTVFGRTYVSFYAKPSQIAIDSSGSRRFKQEHGFHGYYVNSLDNPVQQTSKTWLSKQIKTDNSTAAD